MSEIFDRWFDLFVEADGPGAAVGVELRGERYEACRGLANLEWRAPVDADTVFRIASLTKSFTAAAIVRLAEDGKLGLDDPIDRHLPNFSAAGGIILRHLLNHMSGVGDYTMDPDFMGRRVRNDHSTAELVAIIAALPRDFAPGERCVYNNAGYVLLGAVIEACSSLTYADYLRQAFFAPLGLAHTRYLHDDELVPKRAAGYSRTPDLRPAPPLAMTNPHGAGALGSTVGDLLTWFRALREGRVVSSAGYRAMTAPARPRDGRDLTRGFGLFRYSLHGDTVISHSGEIFGFRAHFAHWPAHELTVVALANSSPFPVERLAHGLARRALGHPDAAPSPIKLDPDLLAASAGRFMLHTTEVIDLAPLDGGLTSNFPFPGARYLPFTDDRFFLTADPEVTLSFTDPARRSLLLQDYRSPMVAARMTAR